jgi:transcription termination factor Rho
MNLQELKKRNPAELIAQAEKLGIENPSTLRKQEILFVFWNFYRMVLVF